MLSRFVLLLLFFRKLVLQLTQSLYRINIIDTMKLDPSRKLAGATFAGRRSFNEADDFVRCYRRDAHRRFPLSRNKNSPAPPFSTERRRRAALRTPLPGNLRNRTE